MACACNAAPVDAGAAVADVAKTGTLTQAQAQKSRLGYVANNFGKIDVNKTGKVTFDDVKHYVQSQP